MPIYLDSIGTGWNQENVYRPNGIPLCHYLVSKKNDGIIEIDNKVITLSEGQSIFINENIPHKYFKKSGEWITAFLTFNGSNIQDLLNTLEICDYVVINDQETTEINLDFGQLLSLIKEKTIKAELLYSAILYKILTNIVAGVRNESQVSFDNRNIKHIIEYIDQNYQSPITNDVLSEISNYSVQHMTRIFKLIYGVTPMNYLRQIRIMKAKEFLIGRKHLSIQAVAELAGFTSENYFIEVFRNSEGTTPLKYRKLY